MNEEINNESLETLLNELTDEYSQTSFAPHGH